MKYPTIRIEGSILAADILENIEKGEGITGQKTSDFKIEGTEKVKDEIARAWADAQSYWGIFKRKRELLEADERQTGTSETRNQWMIPFLGLLGYKAEFSRSEEVMGKSYAISHRDPNLDGFPMHIMGFKDNLDVKRKDGGPRMSPHALVQEYLNLTEHLYALVTNGLQIRLLRDSSRLIKLSFLEFDLERMMEEEHYADFAILYRLLHFTRMPVKQDAASESLIETYHTNSLESGSRIRDGLSQAVERSILQFSNGFLQHPKNDELRAWIEDGDRKEKEKEFYQWQLRLIYRLLFLMVIEERDLIFPKEADRKQKSIYYDYYSINRLRKLSERRYLADAKYSDYWQSIQNTFRLFENEKYGAPLGIKPLAGDLFDYNAVGVLNESTIDNKIVLECLKSLSLFKNEATGQIMRVNYASLNVEEFGSVYEGLLEYDPSITLNNSKYSFDFVAGDDRSASGSHYTPDELVQPLIKNSLDYVIREKLKHSNQEEALLSITVCDVACGSGHILLNAARRIATELAIIRSGEEQPSPSAFRSALRDVIRNCIYGVDLNPLAVELCKVALWLEAHNPNEPLNFLDHHIKCGNAVVGLTRFTDLENGIASEAFKWIKGDDKEIANLLKKKNDSERKIIQAEKSSIGQQVTLGSVQDLSNSINEIQKDFDAFTEMPERNPKEIREKSKAYNDLTNGEKWFRLKQLADIQIAQFFIPKTSTNKDSFTTEARYRSYLSQGTQIHDRGASMAISVEKKFFHWFLEFPQVFKKGGFDCILGNPPFLGGATISTHYGHALTKYLYHTFAPAKNRADLVVYFVRRAMEVIDNKKFVALITTNSISEGDSREGGFEYILETGNSINYAIRSLKWPGISANLYVSLFSIYKGEWTGPRWLDDKKVDFISEYFEDYRNIGNPYMLEANAGKMYLGSKFLGDGFIISKEESRVLLKEKSNENVVFPLVNGREINNSIEDEFSRYIINFWNWSLNEAQKYKDVIKIVEERVRPERERSKDSKAKNEWWLYARPRMELYNKLKALECCFVSARTTKYFNLSLVPTNAVFTDALCVLADDSYSTFVLLQSSIHNEWARKYSSKLKTDLRYSNTDAFETFPIYHLENDSARDKAIATNYLNTLSALKTQYECGLTKLFNIVHDPKNQDEQINHFRELIIELDQYVLSKFGWEDIKIKHDFHEIEYLPQNDNVRFAIDMEARKEVLKRLLLLNHEQYQIEVENGLHIKSTSDKKVVKKKSLKPTEKVDGFSQTELFESPNLFNQKVSSGVVEVGSVVLIEPTGKEAKWFSIGAQAKDAQKLSEDSAMAKKILGKKAGDTVDFGNGFKILEVK